MKKLDELEELLGEFVGLAGGVPGGQEMSSEGYARSRQINTRFNYLGFSFPAYPELLEDLSLLGGFFLFMHHAETRNDHLRSRGLDGNDPEVRSQLSSEMYKNIFERAEDIAKKARASVEKNNG